MLNMANLGDIMGLNGLNQNNIKDHPPVSSKMTRKSRINQKRGPFCMGKSSKIIDFSTEGTRNPVCLWYFFSSHGPPENTGTLWL